MACGTEMGGSSFHNVYSQKGNNNMKYLAYTALFQVCLLKLGCLLQRY